MLNCEQWLCPREVGQSLIFSIVQQLKFLQFIIRNKNKNFSKKKKKVLKIIQAYSSVVAKEWKERDGRAPEAAETRKNPNLMR